MSDLRSAVRSMVRVQAAVEPVVAAQRAAAAPAVAAPAAGASPAPPPPPPPSPPARDGSVGVFVTPQSLVTFPVASVVVLTIWKVLGSVVPAWHDARPVGLVVALVVGVFVYYISRPDTADARARRIAAGVGVINCFFLAASALGIDTAVFNP